MQISDAVTTMCLHFDEDEREDDGSRDWDSIKRVSRRKFRIKELEILMMRSGYKCFFEGSSQKRIGDVARVEMELYAAYELFRDIVVGFQSSRN